MHRKPKPNNNIENVNKFPRDKTMQWHNTLLKLKSTEKAIVNQDPHWSKVDVVTRYEGNTGSTPQDVVRNFL